MNYRFSHHARRALTHATLLVHRFRHAAVDTGHLLAGLMLTEGSIAYQVLRELNLTYERAEPYLRTMYRPVKPLPDEVLPNDALNNTLLLASDESVWMGKHYVGTEHLLLGLCRTNAGGGDNLLKRLDVDPEVVRRRLRRLLSDGLTEFAVPVSRRNARLSELARRVCNAAEQISVELDHRTVGLGHLLLAMLLEQRSPVSTMLRAAGLNEMRLRRGIERRETASLVSIEHIVNLSLDHSEDAGSHYTGTEHLLLTFATEREGAMVLRLMGVNPDALREQLEDFIRKHS